MIRLTFQSNSPIYSRIQASILSETCLTLWQIRIKKEENIRAPVWKLGQRLSHSHSLAKAATFFVLRIFSSRFARNAHEWKIYHCRRINGSFRLMVCARVLGDVPIYLTLNFGLIYTIWRGESCMGLFGNCVTLLTECPYGYWMPITRHFSLYNDSGIGVKFQDNTTVVLWLMWAHRECNRLGQNALGNQEKNTLMISFTNWLSTAAPFKMY